MPSTPFIASRLIIFDAALFVLAFISPRLFSLYVIFAYPRYRRELSLSRNALIKKVLSRSRCKSLPRQNFSEAWLISVQPHMREKTMLSVFGKKITRAYSMSGSGGVKYDQAGIPLHDIARDWIAVWLLIFEKHMPGRLFVLSGLSDAWFMPLKLHMFASHIAFDSYDPMGEYRQGKVMHLFNRLNYKLGKLYIVRDARFKKALRASKNWKAGVCYLPDATQFEIMDQKSLAKKFAAPKIKFVSAGWVTTEGDGGILRSFQLIKRLWPDSEIHLCLTQFMRPEDKLFAPLIKFMEENEGCFVHQNLQNEDYRAMLDNAHVGLNLHDPNVFGESYKEITVSMIRRSPSARVLDFAARGCILMTTREHSYSRHIFKQYSPHKAVMYLSHKTQAQELTSLIHTIRERAA